MTYVIPTPMFRSLFFLTLLVVIALPARADLEPEARRRLQWPDEPAHLLVPLPYSMPGIGEGFFLMGYFSNLLGSTADAAVIRTEGDAQGTIVQLDEIPLIKEHLHLSLFSMDMNKASIQDYAARGMEADNSYNLLGLEGIRQNAAALTLNLWERRLALSAEYHTQRSALSSYRDDQGTLIWEYADPVVQEGESRQFSLRLDLTDDHLDPRRGLSFDMRYSDRPADSVNDPDYYVLDYSLLYYVPFNGVDTLALNYYRSDAHLRRQGLTDPAAVAATVSSGCVPSDNACLAAEAQHAQNVINANRYGTANSLGGTDRMRSYAGGRFSGAHAEFVGVEFRTNFIQDAVPFDYLMWKDVHTSIQLALFAEVGTVAETTDALWDQRRHSYGIGGRLLSASGSVYRADYAMGDEGAEFTIFFFYPWK